MFICNWEPWYVIILFIIGFLFSWPCSSIWWGPIWQWWRRWSCVQEGHYSEQIWIVSSFTEFDRIQPIFAYYWPIWPVSHSFHLDYWLKQDISQENKFKFNIIYVFRTKFRPNLGQIWFTKTELNSRSKFGQIWSELFGLKQIWTNYKRIEIKFVWD